MGKFYQKRSMLLLLTGIAVLGGQYGAYATPNDSPTHLEKMIVTARRPVVHMPGDYSVRETEMGVLGSVDYMNIPVQSNTLTQKAIAINKSPGSTIWKVATLDPSVTSKGTNTYNTVAIRGFSISAHDYYLNGISGLLSSSSIPMNFVDRLEIISGPSSLLMGVPDNGSVGGSINVVPKVAEDNKIAVTESFSGKSNWEHGIDISSRWGKNQQWGVRLVADYSAGNTEYRNETMTRKNVFVNLDYRDEKSNAELLYGYRYVHQNAPVLGLYIGEFDLPKAPDGDANFQLPWSQYLYNNDILALSYERKLTPSWQVFFKAGYQDEDWRSCFESYYPELLDNKGNFAATLEELPIKFWRLSLAAGIRGELQTGNLKHKISLSADRLSHQGRGQDWWDYDKQYLGNIYDHSIENPAYQIPQFKLTDWYYSGAYIFSGVSVVDIIEPQMSKWTFLAGIRRQNEKSFTKHDGKDYTKTLNTSANILNLGAMYAIQANTKLYFNYMEGVSKGYLVPAGRGYSNQGEYLPPKPTDQYEFGVKWEDDSWGGSASIFRLEQGSLQTDAKKRLGYSGKVKNSGLQVTATGKFNDKLNWSAGLMYLDSLQKGGTNDGKTISGISKWNVTASGDYQLNDRFSVNARVHWNSSAYIDSANSKTVPSWFYLDVGGRYEKRMDANKSVFAQLNIFNVLNRNYWIASGNNVVRLGGPRTLVFTVGYEF